MRHGRIRSSEAADGTGGSDPYRKRIAVIAGEESGEHLAAALIAELARHDPAIRFIGVGAERMERSGAELIARSRDLSVLGFTEVIRNYPRLRRRFREVVRRISEPPVDLLITVDFPGFNLRLAREASRKGIPTLHLVSPQIWAWRSWRIRSVRSAIDELVVIFPFEVEYYRTRGVDVHYFGHPGIENLMREKSVRRQKRDRLRGEDPRPIVAWLPGSRPGEIERHLPVVAEAIQALEDLGLRHIVSVAPSVDSTLFEPLVDRTGCELHEASDVLLEAATAALVKSGTSTVEAMAIGTPFALFYRVPRITAWIARRLSHVRFLAMPNIIADHGVVREYVQEDCTAGKLSAEVRRLLDPEENRRIREELNDLVREGFGEGSEVIPQIARFVSSRFFPDGDRQIRDR